MAESSKSTKEFSDLASVALLPVSIIAFGAEAQPIERLLSLQSSLAKGVHIAAVAGQSCFRLSVRWRPSLLFPILAVSQADLGQAQLRIQKYQGRLG
jgi:hypothetical protein